MKLDYRSFQTTVNWQPSYLPSCPIHAYINQPPEALEASLWVKLVEAPSDWSDDEALLLCQESENRWLAWIPGYGEASLLNLSLS
jgi:hypothetical protein